jgi:hypothetical protein
MCTAHHRPSISQAVACTWLLLLQQQQQQQGAVWQRVGVSVAAPVNSLLSLLGKGSPPLLQLLQLRAQSITARAGFRQLLAGLLLPCIDSL